MLKFSCDLAYIYLKEAFNRILDQTNTDPQASDTHVSPCYPEQWAGTEPGRPVILDGRQRFGKNENFRKLSSIVKADSQLRQPIQGLNI